MQWPTETQELAHGVFAYVQAGGGMCIANAGLIAAPDGVTAIDALFTPAMTHALLDEAQRVAAKPVTRLLNTHHHIDHTLGNALFPAATTILAHARAKAEMERVGLGMLGHIAEVAPHFRAEVEGATARLPDATFDGAEMELAVGQHRVRLIHLGTGHTRGDGLVFLPEEKILYAGDMAFFYVSPLAFEGHIGNWIKLGERIIDEIDADVIVPGHGPVGGKQDLRLMLDYFVLLRDGARKAFDAGAGVREATESRGRDARSGSSHWSSTI